MGRKREFFAAIALTLGLAAGLRFAWLTADPPVAGNVGIVWHDEGAWVHNARNRALWGTWRTDNWNPVFVAPVFTALEWTSFELFGVGTWQARVVPAASGLVAVLALVAGLSQLTSRRIAIAGGLLLAANYAWVMWNRAALMESTMTMWMVVAWSAYALADRRPVWGVFAGMAAAAAWFTKAAAAFFVAALLVDLLWRLVVRRDRSSLFTATGLAVAFVVVAVAFVGPNWTEYRFYNWQMSVTRKPEYTLTALADRASWLPVVQSIFGRMWIELALGSVGLLAILARWRDARPAERLLVLWVFLGLAELIVHDSGNERRYVMFIPAFIAAAGVLIGRAMASAPIAFAAPQRPEAPRAPTGPGPTGPRGPTAPTTRAKFFGLPLWLPAAVPLVYLVAGSALRWWFLDEVEAHRLSMPVRLAALTALVAGLFGWWFRLRLSAWLAAPRLGLATVGTLIGIALGGQAWQYAEFVSRRATTNHDASVALGRRLQPGTVVQGKLANGMALENRIRPLFVGNGFGNYEDRLQRDDARYILTYDLPRVGYESSDGSGLIQGILERYPRRQIVDQFIVDETPEPDRAVLIDKFPGRVAVDARD